MPKLQHWADLIASGRADDFKETALLPDFLTDIFCDLLGYTRPAGPADTFTLSRETHVEVDGKFADAVLGRFQKDKQQFIVALEGKGTRDPLDRRVRSVASPWSFALPDAAPMPATNFGAAPPIPTAKASAKHSRHEHRSRRLPLLHRRIQRAELAC